MTKTLTALSPMSWESRDIRTVEIPEGGELRNAGLLDIHVEDVRYYEMPGMKYPELMESIHKNGIQEPIIAVVVPADPPRYSWTRYRLLDGYPTWCCALNLGINEIPIRVVDLPEEDARSIWQYNNWSTLLNHMFNFRLVDWNSYVGGLRDIAEAIAFRDQKKTVYFKAKYLDEIARGCKSKRHRYHAEDNFYFCIELLHSSMRWWIGVLRQAQQRAYWGWESLPERPYIDMNAVYSSIADAERARELRIITKGTTVDGTPALELFKNYRIFTRSVCSVVQETWPGVNFQKLLDEI